MKITFFLISISSFRGKVSHSRLGIGNNTGLDLIAKTTSNNRGGRKILVENNEFKILKYKVNHFALKTKLYMTAIRQVFDKLRGFSPLQ